MTIRQIALALLTGTSAGVFVGCNSSVQSAEETAGNAAVKSFSLAANTKILQGLDSVFFSIDLIKGQIFNADSLPVGTRVNALVPQIVTYDGASVAELTVTRAGRPDTVINYLKNSSDSIDFTNPVKLRLVSTDGLVERIYTIKVNVHRCKSDSLTWGRNDRTTLPSSFGYPAQQRTARMGDAFYCLTRSENAYCLASFTGGVGSMNRTMPGAADWSLNPVTFNFTPDVASFSANDSALFILDTDGNLYTSADGLFWEPTSMKWHSVYGGYGDTLLGAVYTDGGWMIQTWPSGATVALPQDMPVSDTSVPVCYSFEMGGNPQMLLVGGRKTDGSLSRDTWGYDGSSWAKVSQKGLPQGLGEVAVAPYYSLSSSTLWDTTEMPSLIAFGGRKSDGSVNNTVYISNDYGYHWSEAPACLQLPSYITAAYGAQAYVMTTTLSGQLYQPKVSSSTIEWECPYIYLFGGINAGGSLQNTVWRGVIRHFTFIPVV